MHFEKESGAFVEVDCHADDDVCVVANVLADDDDAAAEIVDGSAVADDSEQYPQDSWQADFRYALYKLCSQ